MDESRDNAIVWRDEAENRDDHLDGARSELLAEAIADVRTRAQRYVQEPAEAAWHDLVEALMRTYGDAEAYNLLRAVSIHSQIWRP